MTKAHLFSVLVFMIFQIAALVAFASLGGVAFAFIGMAGCLASSVVFNRLASTEERRRDLEDRVRNPPP